MASTNPLVVIVGQTASGKSALGLSIAETFDGEIICGDARTVYKGMDIGTAKPTALEQKRIRHHLIDIVEPNDQYTAADFQYDANKVISIISKKGKLPIIVGGTGMYIDGLLFNYTFLPKTDEKYRQNLQQRSPKELMLELDELGIKYDNIDSNNPRRLMRLLETNGKIPEKSKLRDNTLILGIDISRTDLRKRIEGRVATMLRKGLKHEVNSLLKVYGWQAPGLNAIGYREWVDYFDDKISRGEVERKIIRSTLGLAKRQRTWFKRHKQIHWVQSPEQANQLVAQFLNK